MSDLAQIGDLAQIAKSADVHISTSPSGLFYIAHGRKTFISLYFVRRRKTFIFALFCAWMKNIYSHFISFARLGSLVPFINGCPVAGPAVVQLM